MAGIRRYIGRMIGGWVSALVLSIVTALVKKAMANAAARSAGGSPFQSHTVNTGRPATEPAAAPKSQPVKVQPYKQWAVQDAIYQGMRKSELIAAYGQPDDKARPTFDKEVWTYLKDGSNDNETPAMTVTMDKGIVTDWAEN